MFQLEDELDEELSDFDDIDLKEGEKKVMIITTANFFFNLLCIISLKYISTNLYVEYIYLCRNN